MQVMQIRDIIGMFSVHPVLAFDTAVFGHSLPSRHPEVSQGFAANSIHAILTSTLTNKFDTPTVKGVSPFQTSK